jgi:hypothetical protein
MPTLPAASDTCCLCRCVWNAGNLSTQGRCGFALEYAFPALTPMTWAIPADLAIQVFDVEPIEVPSCSISSYASSVTGSGIVRAMGHLATPAASAICAAIGRGSCWSIHRQAQSSAYFCAVLTSPKRGPMKPERSTRRPFLVISAHARNLHGGQGLAPPRRPAWVTQPSRRACGRHCIRLDA